MDRGLEHLNSLRERTISEPCAESRSPGGSSQRINIITGAWSIHPSIASTFSLEKSDTRSPPVTTPSNWVHQRYPYLEDAGQVSTSCQEHLEQAADELDDPAYMDTITSNDSAGSMLRRSFSVPAEYVYQPSNKSKRKLAQEIFADFLPPGDAVESATLDTTDDLALGTSNVKDKRLWRQTMEDLLEHPEYTDSLTSTSSRRGLLARQAVMLACSGQGYKARMLPPCQEVDEVEAREPNQPVNSIKNLLVLSFSFFFEFCAYLSVRNLQSSLNHEGGLGLYALSSVYASIFVGCTMATTIVQLLRPKLTMILAMISLVVYVLANFYPKYYTLLPACVLVGFSLSNLWTAEATYLIGIASSHAELTRQTLGVVITKFNGIFFFFFQLSQILGGVISSTVLMSGPTLPDEQNISKALNMYENSTEELVPMDYSHCGVNYYHNETMDSRQADVSKLTVYILMGVYTGFTLVGLATITVFLDPLEGIMKKPEANIHDQLTAVFRFFGSGRVVCLLGLMFYTMLQASFLFGEFTKSFVTCVMGVYMVGYVLLCASACCALTSFFNAYLHRWFGRVLLFFAAAIIQLGCLITMLLWQPSPSQLPVFFIISGAWGAGDGLIMTQTISMFGMLFPENKEPAFSGMKMCQSLGTMLLFLTAPYLCTELKIYIMIGVLVTAMAGYAIMEISDRQKEKQDMQKSKSAPGTPV